MTHLNVACGCLHGSTYRWKDGHVRFFFWHNDLLNDCYCERSVTTKGQLGRSIIAVEVEKGNELNIEALPLNLTAEIEFDELFLRWMESESGHDNVVLMVIPFIVVVHSMPDPKIDHHYFLQNELLLVLKALNIS